MRSLLLFLVVGLAVAAKNTDNASSAFRAKREYTYKYETQIVTGNQPSSSIHSGFKMSAMAHVQFDTYSIVRVRFEDITLFTLEQPIVQYDADKNIHPNPNIRELVGKDAEIINTFLRIPFGWTYDDGHIVKVHLSDKETWWSANAKRGFVSLFEINLEKRFQLPDYFPPSHVKIPRGNDIYTVLEQSPEGDCATIYAKEQHLGSDNAYVFKTRDFDKCLRRPVYLSTMFDGMPVADSLRENPLTVQTHIHYNLKTQGKKFIIYNAVADGTITFAPYAEKYLAGEQGELRTTVNQTLILLDTRELIGQSMIPEIQEGKNKAKDLRITLPTKQVDHQDPFNFQKEEPQMESNPFDVYPVEKIYEMLRMVAENNKDLTSDEALIHLRMVSDMLRTSPRKTLKALWNKLYSTRVAKDEVDRLAAEIYFNLLPNIATQPCTSQILDICESDPTITNNCTLALNVLTLKAKVTPRIIRDLLILIRNKRSIFSTQLKQAAYLTLGSFGYKLAKEKHHHDKELDKAEEILKPLLKENIAVMRNIIRKRVQEVKNNRKSMMNTYTQLGNEIIDALDRLFEKGNFEDKILALKSLANSGLPFVPRVLKKIVDNPKQPQFLRILAVMGYRRIRYFPAARLEAIETLYKVFADHRETSEMRNMAFVVLVGLQPCKPIMEKMANTMNYEKDVDVSNFVIGFMENIANSTFEPIWPLSRNFTVALKTAPIYKPGFDHSFFKYFGSYYPEYKMGRALSLTTIGTANRYEGWSFNYDTVTYGLYSKFLEIGVNTEGLSPLLNKLFGPKGIITNNKSIFDILKRKPRDISPMDYIQKIFEELKIKPRDTILPRGHIYFKMMGHELRYFDFTNIIRDITTSGKTPFKFDRDTLEAGMPFHLKKVMFLFNTKLTLPTTAGFPVSLQLQLATNMNTKGTFSFKVEPNLLEEERQGNPPVKVIADIDMDAKMVTGIYGTMGLDAFFVKSTHGFYGLMKWNSPVKNSLTYDLTHRKLELHHAIPERKHPMIEIKMEPVSETYILTTKDETPIMLYQRNPIYASEGATVKPLYIPYDMPFLGWRSEITGQVPRRWNHPMLPFKGRTIMNLWVKPMEKPAEEIVVRAQFLYPPYTPYPLSYARTYQETMYGKDEEKDYADEKFDKFGRPRPTKLDDILPYEDPVDLKRESINLVQLLNKLQQKLGQAMPMLPNYYTRGVVVAVESVYKEEKRQAGLDFVWSKVISGQMGRSVLRLYRTPIDEKAEFELVGTLDYSYPTYIVSPNEVFNVDFQKALVQELKFHLKHDTTQEVNNIMNQTILSVNQQTNFEAKKKITAYRVLEALIPQQLDKLNVTDVTEGKRDWTQYWKDLMPLYDTMLQEDKLSMDPYFSSREGMLMANLQEFVKIQERLRQDFRDIVNSQHALPSAEFPIIQWISLKQDEVLFMFNRIVIKDFQKGLITHERVFKDLLHRCYMNARVIVEDLDKIVKLCFDVENIMKDQDYPSFVTKPVERQQNPNNRDIFDDEPSYYSYNSQEDRDEDIEVTKDKRLTTDLKILRNELYKLQKYQMDVIYDIQVKLTSADQIDFDLIEELIKKTRFNMTFFDEFFKREAIDDPVVYDQMTMITVCNEFVVRLIEESREYRAYKYVEPVNAHKRDCIACDNLILKILSLQIAPRVAYLDKARQAFKVMLPEMTTAQLAIWTEVQDVKRSLVVNEIQFKNVFAYNFTTMQNPELASVLYKQFVNRYTTDILKLQNIITNMKMFPAPIPVYLVTELMESVYSLKYLVEYSRVSTLPVAYSERMSWIEMVDKQATSIQTLISDMYPLFDKLRIPKDDGDFQVPSARDLPIDIKYLGIIDLLQQQKGMLDQIRNFLRTKQVSNSVQQKVVEAVVDRLAVIHEIIKDHKMSVLKALDQMDADKIVSFNIFSKAMNQHRIILELIKSTLEQRRDNLRDVSDLKDKVSSMEYDLSSIDSELNNKYVEVMDQKQQDRDYADYYIYNDQQDYRQQKDKRAERPYQGMKLPIEGEFPASIRGILNVTWGTSGTREKKAIVQILAIRSVEQLFYLWKQLNPIIRGQEFVKTINYKLQDRLFDIVPAVEILNTYNHIHSITTINRNDVPKYIRRLAHYVQDFLKVKLWDYYSLEDPAPSDINTDRIETVFDLSDINHKFDLYLMNKYETNLFSDVPLKRWIKYFLPNKGVPHFLRKQVARYLTDGRVPPVCHLYKDQLQTFDKVSYRMIKETEQCEKLLAMDCSPEKTFAITTVKSKESFDGHAIRILNENKMVEIIPGYMDVQVKVNGEYITLKEDEPIDYKKQFAYQLYEPSLSIIRKGLKVIVDLHQTGIQVKCEGSHVQIEVSMLFKNRMCGLCSNFDSQPSWEYEGPLREIYTNSHSFIKAYLLPFANPEVCPAYNKAGAEPHELPHLHANPPPMHPDFSPRSKIYQEVMRPFRPKGGEPKFDLSEDDQQERPREPCSPVMEHSVKYRKSRKIICISEKPVTVCPFDCPEVESSKRERVRYVCINNDKRNEDLQKVIELLKREISNGAIEWAKHPEHIQKNKVNRRLKTAQSCKAQEF